MHPQLCIGLMSGTSMDAVDAALCRLEGGRVTAIESTARCTYPDAVRARLLAVQSAPDTLLSLRELAALDNAVAETFATAALQAIGGHHCSADAVAAIGSHGQTVFHDPAGVGNSLQIGNPSLIAARTGIRVVSDFRRADIARGGQGAPLVPAFHRSVFGAAAPCAILNIGGIANLTLLPADGPVLGFDTGPGNALMDAWIFACTGSLLDTDGAWAASGRVHPDLLSACLRDPYFATPPPKSTGRDRFNLDWVRRCFPDVSSVDAASVQRTLCELTTRTVAQQLRKTAPDTRALFACGGGVHNQTLIDSLRAALPSVHVSSTAELGIAPEWVEAAAFAWLAWQRLQEQPGNLTSVTGASRPAVLGGIYSA